MGRTQRMSIHEWFVMASSLFFAAVLLAKLGWLDADLIKEATGSEVSGSDLTTASDANGGGDLAGVMDRLTDKVQAFGLVLIPLAGSAAGIAWMAGSPKGPRFVLSVVGAGLLVLSAPILAA